jgi:hypothetical protein
VAGAERSLLTLQQLWIGLTEKMRFESHLFQDVAIRELLEALRTTSRAGVRDDPLIRHLDFFGVVAQRVQFLRLSRQL